VPHCGFDARAGALGLFSGWREAEEFANASGLGGGVCEDVQVGYAQYVVGISGEPNAAVVLKRFCETLARHEREPLRRRRRLYHRQKNTPPRNHAIAAGPT
jgi:hypothetical protein